MPLTIEMRFAIDANHNHKVEPEEIVGLDGLAEKDGNGDGVLTGREFEDVYYEYGKDVWLPADRETRLQSDDCATYVRMNKINVKTGAVDMNIHLDVRS